MRGEGARERASERAWRAEVGPARRKEGGDDGPPRGLPDQIVCEARGSARGLRRLGLRSPSRLSLRMGPAGAVFSSAGSRDYY